MECESFIDYIRFLIQKDVDKMIIDLDTKGFTLYVNIIRNIVE